MLYNAFVEGTTVPLKPLRIQYKDFAVWEQDKLNGVAIAEHKAYWLKQFEGQIPVLELPGYQPRPLYKDYKGTTVEKRIDHTSINAFRQLCQSTDCTLFMGLLSIVKILLYRYTSQQDIIVGIPSAGREHLELADQVGLYVNTLALRTRLSVQDAFLNILSKIKKTTLQAYRHQAYPFDELIDSLKLHRDPGRNPLFDVLVNHQDNNREDFESQKIGDLSIGS